MRQLFNRKIKKFDIVILLRQLATLIAANIPIIKTFDILEKSQHKPRLKLLIYAIKYNIAKGEALHDSFKKHPNYFDELTCQMIHIGEQTGKLDQLLLEIAHSEEKQLQFKRKVQQALVYPVFIILTAMAVTLCMILFIIPRFAELFGHMHGQLPLLTQYVFAFSLTVKKYFWLFIFVFIIFSGIFYFYTHKQHSSLQEIGKTIPFIKNILRKIVLIRFCRNLATSFASGVPISDALQLSANTKDLEFLMLIARLRTRVQAGFLLNIAMESMIYFPKLMVELVKIGEESGLLVEMLNKIADFFEADIDQLTSMISQILEPLIILTLGVLIGGLVIAMYLPIFKLGNIM